MKPRALTARSLRRADPAAAAPIADPTRGGVGGVTPPLISIPKGNLLSNGPKSSASAAPTRAARGAPTSRKYTPRAASGRPVRQGWRGWVSAVSAQLEARGARELAHNLRSCGATARVRPCDGCGDQCAAVEVRASCGLRVCPFCARLAAREKVQLVASAVERVEHYQRQRAPEAAARVAEERAKAEQAAQHWAQRAAVARVAGREAVASRHEGRAHAAAERAALARREAAAIRDLPRWSWKLVTVTTRWNPLDPREYEPAALRRRVARALESWRLAWDAGARAGGLAAATVRVELAPHGMVHIHALYRGPFIRESWWQRVAGCIVNVKRVDDFGGIVETVKYTLKMPTPTAAEWVGGDARRVVHPRLAASWLVATRRAQLLRHVGTMREAVEAVEACTPADAEERAARCACASCGADLSGVEPVLCSTAGVARYLGPRWAAGPPPPDIFGRQLPRRVSFARSW